MSTSPDAIDILLTGGTGGIGRAIIDRLSGTYSCLAPTRLDLDMADPRSVALFLKQRPYLKPRHIIFAHGTWMSRPRGDRALPALDPDWDYQYRERIAVPWTLVERLINRGGLESVTVVSSTRAFIGGVDTAAYSAMCAAQLALVSGYARELPHIQFNAVCPGLTATPMGAKVMATGGARPGAVPQDPAAVAQACVQLIVSRETGIILRIVDGKIARMTWTAASWN